MTDTAVHAAAAGVPSAGPPSGREPVWRRCVRGLGELLLTLGSVALLFVVYQLYVTDLFTQHAQHRLADQLHEQWSQGATSSPAEQLVVPPVGQPLAEIRIPRLGSGYDRVVVEGTGQDQLAQGPGHYVGTALPGQRGNLAIAGHRVGKGSPFLDLDQLRPGDPIVIETAQDWYVYRVLGDRSTGDLTSDPSGIPGQQVVLPTDVDVIDPTPNAPGAAASRAYLTLTTCNPKYSARQRLVVHAVLDGGPVSKASAPDGPAALSQG